MDKDEKAIEQYKKDNYRAGLIIENSLLRKVNGSTILEYKIKNNENIQDCFFNQRESLKIILKYKRYDLLPNVTIRNLLRTRNTLERETYLDYILRLSKKNSNINRSFLDPFDGIDSLKDIADFYIIYAKHDLEGYLPPLTDDVLLKEEKSPVLRTLSFNKNFLKLLLRNKENEDIVKDKLLSKSQVQNLDVILSLNEKDKNYKASIEMEDDYAHEYYEEQNATFECLYNTLRPKEQALLEELKDILLDRCDTLGTVTVMYSYIEQLCYGNKEATYREIRMLINIFKNDKDFTIKAGEGDYFSPLENKISLTDISRSTLNHELGHMLFHKLTDTKIDPYFYYLLDNVKNNPRTLNKISSLSDYYRSLNTPIKKIAVDYYKEKVKEDLSPGNERRISRHLSKEKKVLIEEYQRKGYSKAVINNILNRSYTLDEYKQQHKKIQIRALKESIRREKIGPIIQIADIIDAIYKGEFLSSKLEDENGKIIKPVSGHGLFYYNNRPETVFDEIFADYCAIRKNCETNAVYYIDPVKGPISDPVNCLREIVGNELVDFLEDFYYREILDSKKYDDVRRL